jgi:hypothetical protein
MKKSILALGLSTVLASGLLAAKPHQIGVGAGISNVDMGSLSEGGTTVQINIDYNKRVDTKFYFSMIGDFTSIDGGNVNSLGLSGNYIVVPKLKVGGEVGVVGYTSDIEDYKQSNLSGFSIGVNAQYELLKRVDAFARYRMATMEDATGLISEDLTQLMLGVKYTF